jgi:hypothetical protein
MTLVCSVGQKNYLLKSFILIAICTSFHQTDWQQDAHASPRLPDRPCPRGVRKALYLAPAAPRRHPRGARRARRPGLCGGGSLLPGRRRRGGTRGTDCRGQRPCAGLPAARRPAGEVGGRHPPLPCPGKFDDAHRTERTARPGTPAGLAREGTERDAPSRDGAGWLLVQVRISARGDAATAPGRGGQTGWRPGAARRISKRSSTRGERRGSAPWNAGLRCTNAGDRDRYQPDTARAQSRRIKYVSPGGSESHATVQ